MKEKKNNQIKDSKEIKSNQDYNWNKNKIEGQLYILVWLARFPRREERKRGRKKLNHRESLYMHRSMQCVATWPFRWHGNWLFRPPRSTRRATQRAWTSPTCYSCHTHANNFFLIILIQSMQGLHNQIRSWAYFL